MKIIDLAAQPLALNEVLDVAAEDNLVLRAADGREFVVAEVDDFDREFALVRQNAELMALLAARSGAERTMPQEEVKRSLGFT
jgi:hypothetical protein